MRVVLVTASEMERKSIELIQTKLACAKNAIENPPKGMNAEEIVLYTKGCVDALGEYQWLEKQFWNDSFKKYKFEHEVVSIDLSTGEFYITKDD